MAQHNDLGKKGEELAKSFLQKKNYNILETNWRYSRAEVDLIVMHNKVLIFVEVKTRSTDYFGQPEEFVTPQKEALMAEAAAVYMEQIGHDWEIRFDIISIIIQKNKDTSIKHIEDAFFPTI